LGSAPTAAHPFASRRVQHNPRKNPLALAFIPAMLKRDAKLTGKGKKQAATLTQPMHWMPFDVIMVSPLTRTIETATAAFEGHATPKRLCHLMCERATMPSDQGTPKAALLKKHPQIAEWQGWDELPDEFWPPRSLKTAEQEVAARVEEFKTFLLQRPEACFALVGHSAFFQTMTSMDRKLACADRPTLEATRGRDRSVR
jgi:broad specificity phosphatase PhoE